MGVCNARALNTQHNSGDKPVTSEAKPKRNPAWSRDEIILALDLYRQLQGGWPKETDERVESLSRTLNQFWRAQGYTGATLRNANGVKMKLMNLRTNDPNYAGHAGLKAGNKLEAEVWADFWARPDHLTETASSIRAAITSLGQDSLPQSLTALIDDADEVEAPEGRLLTAIHHRRERSKKIVQAKKADVLAKSGRLACEACGFDFSERYGARGIGFIECHHTKPLTDLPEETKTRLSDLALVCANCHRMIHSKRPWLTVAEVRQILR